MFDPDTTICGPRLSKDTNSVIKLRCKSLMSSISDSPVRQVSGIDCQTVVTAFKATLVPVGDDHLPMVEQTNELVRRLNRQISLALLPEASALLIRHCAPAWRARSKDEKIAGQAIRLSANDAEVEAAARHMYTDSHHVRATDSGRV